MEAGWARLVESRIAFCESIIFSIWGELQGLTSRSWLSLLAEDCEI